MIGPMLSKGFHHHAVLVKFLLIPSIPELKLSMLSTQNRYRFPNRCMGNIADTTVDQLYIGNGSRPSDLQRDSPLLRNRG